MLRHNGNIHVGQTLAIRLAGSMLLCKASPTAGTCAALAVALLLTRIRNEELVLAADAL